MTGSRAPGHAPAGAADVLVVFGITGDLARVMTLHSLYRLERRGQLHCPVVGVAQDHWSADDLRKYAAGSIEGTGEHIDAEVFDQFAARLSYQAGDLTDPETFRQLARTLQGARLPVFYLALPPTLFAPVVRGLYEAGLTSSARILLEKPFGNDLPSAIALADELHIYLDESQIFRVDHFLGKAGFDELLHLRFANTMFEPVWNRHNVESVQLTLAEHFGVAERGHIYDRMGTLRDVMANHLLELLAAGAMEPPAGADPGAMRDQQASLWEAIVPADPANFVRGQYEGYRRVEGVAPDSETETYGALRLDIDNWRWSGVPFFLRAGKLLPVLQTEFRVVFRRPPKTGDWAAHMPGRPRRAPDPDQVVVRLDPSAGLRLHLSSRGDDDQPRPLVLEHDLGREGFTRPTPYEVLLEAALRGDASRFGRQDGVQQRWRIVQPLLDAPPPVRRYASNSWGPPEAEALLGSFGPWRPPWVESREDT